MGGYSQQFFLAKCCFGNNGHKDCRCEKVRGDGVTEGVSWWGTGNMSSQSVSFTSDQVL